MIANLFLAVILCFGLPAQRSTVPYERDFGPLYENIELDASVITAAEKIDSLDFPNSTLQVWNQRRRLIFTARLNTGTWECNERCGNDVRYESAHLDSIQYLPSGNSRTQYALAVYTWFAASGSSSTTGIAQVYELGEHRLTIKQQFSWDEHFSTSKPYFWFEQKSNSLTIRSAHYLPGDAHCCVSAVDVVTLGWTGSRLQIARARTELSDYGQKAGKKL